MTTNDIKKFLPLNWLESTGRNIPALIKTINDSHQKLEDLISACIDQLFVQTATGRFLIQLGEEGGFTMPPNSGLDIRAYRTLIPIMVAAPKQVRGTFDDLVKAFYQAERTRASIVSTIAAPYSLSVGDNLIIETESGTHEFTIQDGQIANLNDASPEELAAIINAQQLAILADAITNRSSGERFLRLASIVPGAGSYIRTSGGTLQNVLKFPSLIDTQATTGTTWNLTKVTAYSDLLKFTWNGLGVNPGVYLAQADDIVTIRGLVDGAQPYSLLNGSYQLVDVGYDYFVIRNAAYTALSSTLTQPDDNNIVFTDQVPIGLYDQSEFALTSETDVNVLTMTVPAIPPLGRRFLAGSAHLQGFDCAVLDFTRNSIQIQIPLGSDIPVEENKFLLKSNVARFDARKPYYSTTYRDSDPNQPTYIVDSSDENASVLPYTVANPFGSNPIYGTVGSDEYLVTFAERHGLERQWGVTFASLTASENATLGLLNQEHQVVSIPTLSTAVIRLKDTLGNPVRYSGVAFTADVYRHTTPQLDGSDFYLEFATPLLASVFSPGMVFKLDGVGGTDLTFFAPQLRYRNLSVISVSGNTVSFSAGLGAGPEGLIIDNVTGRRSSAFGGNAGTHFLDKASTANLQQVFNDLRAVMMNYTPAGNPLYQGAFLYDPFGETSVVTVSGLIVNTQETIFRGDNLSSLLVDSVASVNGPLPQSGELVLDYGSDGFEGPIRFFAAIEGTQPQILIDPAYRFKKHHDAGASVQVLRSNQIYIPRRLGEDLPAYITGAIQARNTMFALADTLVATGVFIEEDVLLPELRYLDIAISPFE